MNRIAAVLRCVIVSALAAALAGTTASAQPLGDADAERILQQMLEDAKALYAQRLPQRDRMPEWKLPWELPKGIGQGAKTEDEYWQNVTQRMGFAGVTEDHARKMLDHLIAMMGDAGRAEGITPRDGIVMMLQRLESTDAPTAIKYLNSWESSLAMMKLAVAQAGGGQPAMNQANRAIIDAFSARYKDLSDDQLKDLYAKKSALVAKRTQMSYYKSNNWTALTQATSESDLVRNGVWLGVVKIDLMIADKSRLNDPLDLDPANAVALQTRLRAAVRGVTDSLLQMKQAQIDKKAATADNELARQSVRAEQERFDRERAAAAQTDVKVEMQQFKNLGDNCYYIRVTGVSPETTGMQAGVYSGWLRKGEALCEITLGGNFPLEEMDKQMAYFLTEMSQRLDDYDSISSGLLMIAAAPETGPVAPPGGSPVAPPVARDDKPVFPGSGASRGGGADQPSPRGGDGSIPVREGTITIDDGAGGVITRDLPEGLGTIQIGDDGVVTMPDGTKVRIGEGGVIQIPADGNEPAEPGARTLTTGGGPADTSPGDTGARRSPGVPPPLPPGKRTPPTPAEDAPEFARGAAGYERGNYADALREFDAVLARQPDHFKSLLMRGGCKFYLNDLAGALKDYQRAAEIDPDNADAHRYWAFMELCAGEADRAVQAADRALRLKPQDVEAMMTRAQSAMAIGDQTTAQRHFATIAARAPDRATSLYKEATAALDRRQYVVAALQFQTVLWIDPDQYNAWYGRGTALAARGKSRQAIAAFEKYLEYDRDSEWAARARQEISRLKGR